jgi:hypothetical protein
MFQLLTVIWGRQSQLGIELFFSDCFGSVDALNVVRKFARI